MNKILTSRLGFAGLRGEGASERSAKATHGRAQCGKLISTLSFLFCLCLSANAEAGQFQLSGKFDVSPSGAATYTIPLPVPPGTAGMAPSLSINYSSGSGHGVIGFGWSLGGIDSITRCPRTIAQDGAKGGINYDTNDRYCLDGRRLMAISQTADGTVYGSEIENFSKIISHGDTGGYGPAWFEVHTKSGQTMEFGNTPDSQILAKGLPAVRIWALNRVTDTVGNYLTVLYTNHGADAGWFQPQRIDYTGNTNANNGAGTSPYAAVIFTYGTVQAATGNAITPATYYQAGAPYSNPYLLTNVSTYVGGALVNKYNLTYDGGSVGLHARLTSIQACDNGTGDTPCLLPLTFGYTSGNGLSDLLNNVTTGLGAVTTITYQSIATNPSSPIYTKGTGAAYPQVDLQVPFYVVTQQDSSNGVGGNYSSTYTYAGAKADLWGRGLQGFTQTVVTDLQTGIVQASTYNTLFPLTGSLAQQTKKSGAQLLNFVTNNYNPVVVSAAGTSKRYLINVSSTIDRSWDLDGSAIPAVTTTYDSYDAFGNPLTINASTPDGYLKTTISTYDNDTTLWYLGRLRTSQVTAKIPDGTSVTRSSAFTYYANNGLLKSETVEPTDSTLILNTVYQYDDFGNKDLTTVSGAGITTRSTTVSYDPTGRFPILTINAKGQTSLQEFDGRFGGVTKLTDVNSLVTTWTYDTLGRKKTETHNPSLANPTTTTWNYFAAAGCQATCHIDVTATGQPYVNTYYDVLERQKYAKSPTFGGAGSIIKGFTTYNALGQVQSVAQPYATANPTSSTSYTYDALGRVSTKTNPDTGVITYGYHGLDTTVTDPLGNVTDTLKNSQGNVAKVTDATGAITLYTYYPFDLVHTIRDPLGNLISYVYDTRGRAKQKQDPDLGLWTFGYDALDEVVSQIDAKSQQTTFVYDVLARVTQRVEVGQTSTWTYDTQPYGVGKLATASTNGDYARTESYDNYGRPSETAIVVASSIYLVDTNYDTSSRVSAVVYPTGTDITTGHRFTVNYNYNSTGYLASLSNGNGGAALWTINTADASLSVTRETAGNNVVTNTAYDSMERIQSIGTGANNAIQNFSYNRDLAGNLTSRVDGVNNYTENFSYDALNRVCTAQVGANRATPAGAGNPCPMQPAGYYPGQSATYDATGNITYKSDAGPYHYPASGATSSLPHAVTQIGDASQPATLNNGRGKYGIVPSPAGYTYDGNGNMIQGGGRAIAYTSYNMPFCISSAAAVCTAAGANAVTFAYDSEHRRYKETGPTAQSNWALVSMPGAGLGFVAPSFQTRIYIQTGAGIVAQAVIGSTGNVAWTSYFGVGTVKGAYQVSNGVATTTYYHSEHLGSVTALTGSGGTVVAQYSYDAWGKFRNLNGSADALDAITSVSLQTYTQQEALNEVALIHMNARVYDPQIGRFTSADPVLTTAFGAQGFNRYSYVGNNPLIYTDPSGMCFLGCFWKSDIFRSILAIAVAITGQIELAQPLGPFWAAVVSGAAAGGVQSGNLRGVLTGGLEAALFYGVGSLTDGHFDLSTSVGRASYVKYFGTTNFFLNVGLHGVVGGLANIANGSSFQSGFLSAGFSDAVGPGLATQDADNVVTEAIAGGVGSELGGGKFADGAITGAFGYLYNETAHLGVGLEIPDFVIRGINWAFGTNIIANSGSVGAVWQYQGATDKGSVPFDLGVYVQGGIPSAKIQLPNLDLDLSGEFGFGSGSIRGTFDGESSNYTGMFGDFGGTVSVGTNENTIWRGNPIVNGFSVKVGGGFGFAAEETLTGSFTVRGGLKQLGIGN